MNMHSIVKITEAEMAIVGITHNDIPTLLLGMGTILFGLGAYSYWKFKRNCSKVKCSDIKESMKLLSETSVKIDKLLGALNDHAHDEETQHRIYMKELREAVDSGNEDIARLTGVLIGSQALQKTRKVIIYDND